MKTYRDIYNRLIESSSPGPFNSGYPNETDDLLREEKINVCGSDHIPTSTAALLVYYAMKINELEERLARLEEQK